MKKNFLKILSAIILATAIMLTYARVTSRRNPMPPTSQIAANAPDKPDTTDLGDPSAEDPWKELDNLVKAYYSRDGIMYQGEMKLFDGNGDNDKLLEEKKFEYTYFNNSYSYTLSPFYVVDKPSYTVIVNNDDRVVAVTPKLNEKRKKSGAELFNVADFKNLIEQQNAHVLLTQKGDQRILTIDSLQDATIQGYRIYYSPLTYRISKILVGMVRPFLLDNDSEASESKIESDKQNEDDSTTPDALDAWVYYLEISYSVIKPLSLKPGQFNPENRFVKIQGKKIGLTPEFKNYELFNSDRP